MMSGNFACSFTFAILSTMYVIFSACKITLEMMANAYTGSFDEIGLRV